MAQLGRKSELEKVLTIISGFLNSEDKEFFIRTKCKDIKEEVNKLVSSTRENFSIRIKTVKDEKIVAILKKNKCTEKEINDFCKKAKTIKIDQVKNEEAYGILAKSNFNMKDMAIRNEDSNTLMPNEETLIKEATIRPESAKSIAEFCIKISGTDEPRAKTIIVKDGYILDKIQDYISILAEKEGVSVSSNRINIAAIYPSGKKTYTICLDEDINVCDKINEIYNNISQLNFVYNSKHHTIVTLRDIYDSEKVLSRCTDNLDLLLGDVLRKYIKHSSFNLIKIDCNRFIDSSYIKQALLDNQSLLREYNINNNIEADCGVIIIGNKQLKYSQGSIWIDLEDDMLKILNTLLIKSNINISKRAVSAKEKVKFKASKHIEFVVDLEYVENRVTIPYYGFGIAISETSFRNNSIMLLTVKDTEEGLELEEVLGF